MRRDFNKRLIVPAFLAVSACGDGPEPNPSTVTETGPVETSTTTPVTTTTAATTGESTTGETTTAPTTTGPDTDTGSDTTTGGLPDCSGFGSDMAACEAMVGCAWDYEALMCIVDCLVITDEATCNEAKICFWSTGTCYPPI